VPGDYPTVKAAVQNAITSDIIQIDPGTYYENNINIENTITALTIAGSNPTTTIIDGMGNGTIISIDGTNIQISGLTFRNAGNDHNAINSEKPGPSASNDYHRFTNNIITTSAYGISIGLSNRNTIFNNTFINCPLGGISLTSAANTNITANKIEDSAYGIRMSNSATNTIAANTITVTSYGIYMTGTTYTGNIIKDNTINGRTAGIYSNSDTMTVERNTIIDGSAALYILGKTATINYNKITNSSYGIRVYYTSPTTSSHNIRNNKITGCEWAIDTSYSISNTFKANWIQENTWGISMAFSGSSTFYQNNFINNSVQTAAGTSSNTWSSSGQGNHWSEYNGPDANHDGIGDTPYLIDPIGQDNYPLIDTWSEHDTSIENVTTDTTHATAGQTVNITVTVKNIGKIGTAETFTVTAKRNGTTIQTKQVTNLAAEATQNIVFNWNTTGLASGNYTISATASTVAFELNTDNNTHNNGTVTIEAPIPGDINGDGIVNQQDLATLVQAFGATPESGNWNPAADLNHDGLIDAHDLRILGGNYG
jgi:parallel beta-helix repeat protein